MCFKNDIWKKPLKPTEGFHIQFFKFQLVLGKSASAKRRPFSITRTLYPFCVSRCAETLPPNPDPMMTQS